MLVMLGSVWSAYVVLSFLFLLWLLPNAALVELSVVARGQPYLLVGEFNVEPTKIPCLAKGISAGFWVDLESAWA